MFCQSRRTRLTCFLHTVIEKILSISAWRSFDGSTSLASLSRHSFLPPIWPSCSGSPTPDNRMMCGEPMAPAEKITSRAASTRSKARLREVRRPVARLPSNRTRCTSALVTSWRFGRFSAGRRYVRAVLARWRRVCWQIHVGDESDSRRVYLGDQSVHLVEVDFLGDVADRPRLPVPASVATCNSRRHSPGRRPWLRGSLSEPASGRLQAAETYS